MADTSNKPNVNTLAVVVAIVAAFLLIVGWLTHFPW
jgi:hypothetical protein